MLGLLCILFLWGDKAQGFIVSLHQIQTEFVAALQTEHVFWTNDKTWLHLVGLGQNGSNTTLCAVTYFVFYLIVSYLNWCLTKLWQSVDCNNTQKIYIPCLLNKRVHFWSLNLNFKFGNIVWYQSINGHETRQHVRSKTVEVDQQWAAERRDGECDPVDHPVGW